MWIHGKRVGDAWCRVSIMAVAVLAGALACLAGETDDTVEQARIAWNAFLEQRCTKGKTETSVRRLMEPRCREPGWNRANNETYVLLFLIDDHHQAEFIFRNDGRLLTRVNLERRGRWLRLPDGTVISIPDPQEAALQAAVGAQAVDYVAKANGYSPQELSAFVQRGQQVNSWEVVVTVKSLAVDTPNYLLEVMADGEIKDRRANPGDAQTPAVQGSK